VIIEAMIREGYAPIVINLGLALIEILYYLLLLLVVD
jgi:hypothetical protein